MPIGDRLWVDPDDPSRSLHMPRCWSARCSDRKDGGYRRRPIETARTYPYIEANGPASVSLLVFDVDRPDAATAWRALGARPSLVVVNPDTGRGHVTYALREPVTTGPNGAPGPQLLLRRVHNTVTRVLGADPGFARTFTRNPQHPDHHTTWGSDTYTLADLAAVAAAANGGKLEPAWYGGRGRTDGLEVGSRNVTLFDRLRWWAYAHVHHYTCADVWRSTLSRVADDVNASFAEAGVPPLPTSEVTATVRSVWAYTTSNLGTVWAGVGGRQAGGPRQRRSDSRAAAVRTVVDAAPASSVAQIAARAGVSLSTAYRHTVAARAAARTAREAAIADAAARGARPAEIAAQNGVSLRTGQRWVRDLAVAIASRVLEVGRAALEAATRHDSQVTGPSDDFVGALGPRDGLDGFDFVRDRGLTGIPPGEQGALDWSERAG